MKNNFKISIEFILGLLNLEKIGRKTAFKILNASGIDSIYHIDDLMDLIDESREQKSIRISSNINRLSVENAVKDSLSIIESTEKQGISVISFWDKVYPESLRQTQDPPIVLYYKGNVEILSTLPGVAIIGTREPNKSGISAGEFFGKYFGDAGFNVVSGLAIGCDAAGHRGALNSTGTTTAILAHGLHTMYPKENKGLADKILDFGGLLLSEYDITKGPFRNNFVERDRIQSYLSKGTIVIQTGVKGGTMHAVNETIESGKRLAAVQYNDLDLKFEKTQGNQYLIEQKNAFPLTSKNKDEFVGLILNQNKAGFSPGDQLKLL